MEIREVDYAIGVVWKVFIDVFTVMFETAEFLVYRGVILKILWVKFLFKELTISVIFNFVFLLQTSAAQYTTVWTDSIDLN